MHLFLVAYCFDKNMKAAMWTFVGLSRHSLWCKHGSIALRGSRSLAEAIFHPNHVNLNSINTIFHQTYTTFCGGYLPPNSRSPHGCKRSPFRTGLFSLGLHRGDPPAVDLPRPRPRPRGLWRLAIVAQLDSSSRLLPFFARSLEKASSIASPTKKTGRRCSGRRRSETCWSFGKRASNCAQFLSFII